MGCKPVESCTAVHSCPRHLYAYMCRVSEQRVVTGEGICVCGLVHLHCDLCDCVCVCVCTERSGPVQAEVGPVSVQPSSFSTQGRSAQVAGVLTQEGGSAVRGRGMHSAHHHRF